MAALTDYLGPNSVQFLQNVTREQALAALCEALCKDTALDVSRVRSGVAEREKLLTTGIGLGIALPHARLPEAAQFALALGICREGIDYGALDNKPVHIVLLMVGPSRSHEEYVQTMARVTLVLRREEFRKALLAAKTTKDVWKALADSERPTASS
jgi:mannitol/fructose-specific phosphotransferase system IIA component (Ntr-type)